MRVRRENAFTLVEMLVVIGIIGILSAILLSALVGAKRAAQRIPCKNNVRELGQVMQEFRDENHVFPLAYNPDFGKGGYPNHYDNWEAALNHVLGIESDSNDLSWRLKSVWRCPSMVPPATWPKDSVYDESYGYNFFGMLGPNTIPAPLPHWAAHGLGNETGGTSSSLVPVPVRESEVVSPSEMMELGDGFYGNSHFVTGCAPLARVHGIPPSASWDTREPHARHQNRANIAFCDGHVETVTLKFLFEDTSDQALSRWNRDHLPHREDL